MVRLCCPVCDRKFDSSQSAALPFCSERCRLVDLGRWLEERYGLEYESPEKTDNLNPEDI
ncbi:MAG: DNA gyrase inhibitor YacG [Thermoguttaceae bacterium]